MEHYRSVFATAAIMVFGLVAASPILRTENPVPAPSKVPSSIEGVAANASDDPWTDPPRYGTGTASISADKANRDSLGEAMVPKPASFTLLPTETALLMVADGFGKAEATQRGQAVRRHRAAKVASRPRPIPTTETPAGEVPASTGAATAVQPQKDARIDPIGDLLRGLGIGRDS